ncbi:hypothetical protein ABTZ21_30570 [Streptomyces sp. NPDC096191]|uniref:hypothetical protein n=1 Tax=Streptomyces sp. NPDC096191 TaxID=3155426 RepID=UPI00332C4652
MVGKGVGVDAATVGAVPVTVGGVVVTVGAVVVAIGGATGATVRWTGGSVRPPVSGAFEAGAGAGAGAGTGAGVIGVVSEGGVERGAPREERRETGTDGDGAEGPWAAGGTGVCGALEGSPLGRTASAGLVVVGAPSPGRRVVALRCTGPVVATVGVVPGRVGVAGADGPGDPDGPAELVAERRPGADAGAGSPAGCCGSGVPRTRCTGGRVVPDGIAVFVARSTGGTTWEGWAGGAVWGAVGLPGAAALRWTGGCWAPVGVLGRAAGSGCRFAGGAVGDGRWGAVGPSPVPVGRAAAGVPVLPLLGAGLTGPTARWTGGAGAAGAGRVTARWTGVPLGAVRSGADGLRSVAPEGRSCGAVLRWAGVPGAVPPLAGVGPGEGDAVGVGVGVGAAVPPARDAGLAGAEEARCSEPPVAPRSAWDAGAVREPAEAAVAGGTARCTGRSPAPLGAPPDRGTARCTGVCGAASAPGADKASPPGREAPEPELAREGASVRGCCSGTARCTGEPVVMGSGAAADRRSPGSAAPPPRAGSGRVAGAGPDRGTVRCTGVPDAVPPPDREEAPWDEEVGVAGEAGVVGGVAAGAVGVPADVPLPGAGAARFGRGDAARWTGVPEEAPPVGAGEAGLPEARVARCAGGAGGRPGVSDATLPPDGEDELRTGALEAAASPEEAGGRGTDRWTGGLAGVSVAAGPCCCGRTARCTGDAGGATGGVAATAPPESPESGAGATGPAGAEPGSARSPAPDEGAVPEDFGGASAVRRVEGRARRCTAGDPDGALVSGCRGRGGAGGTGVTRTPRAACGEGFTGAADDVDDGDPVERDRWTGVAGAAGAGDDGAGPPPRALGAAGAPPLAPGRADGPADAPAGAPGTAGPTDRVPGV